MSSSDRERVREASDIVQVVGAEIQLKAAGREFVGLCPWHDDKKPSMTVVPAKQIYQCFACGIGGDVFDFVQRYHHIEFREALELLAERAGIELTRSAPRRDASDAPAPDSREALLGAMSTTQTFFRAVLGREDLGEACRALLARRGVSEGMIEQFGIGAAPDRWDGLRVTLEARDRDPGPFVLLGLLKRRESGEGVYDAFRNRLMFPIHDQLGRVIAFGGRRIDDQDEPKYLNSPESKLFDKSQTLYGLHQAQRSIQRLRVAIVVEGYTDVIACHQGGVTNTVATLGTSLTRGHARALKRICDHVVLLFDGDEAGQKAADRAVEVLLGEILDVSIATLAPHTDAKDPAELLQRPDGGEVFRGVIAAGVDILEYRFARLRARIEGQGLAVLDRAITEEIANLHRLGLGGFDPLRRRLFVRRLSGLFGVEPRDIEARLRSVAS